MKSKVAVATVSGRAYFLIVTELKKQNTSFFSLIPGEPVPQDAKVVITTEKEKHLINHERVLVFNHELEPSKIVGEAIKIIQGKTTCNRLVIGVDPGEVFGLAVIADGNIVETENYFSTEEVVNKVENIVKVIDFRSTLVTIKVGNGFPECRDKLLRALDDILPPQAVLEVVNEAGTNRFMSKHRRGLRDIISAIRIAGRNGYKYPREKTNESSP